MSKRNQQPKPRPTYPNDPPSGFNDFSFGFPSDNFGSSMFDEDHPSLEGFGFDGDGGMSNMNQGAGFMQSPHLNQPMPQPQTMGFSDRQAGSQHSSKQFFPQPPPPQQGQKFALHQQPPRPHKNQMDSSLSDQHQAMGENSAMLAQAQSVMAAPVQEVLGKIQLAEAEVAELKQCLGELIQQRHLLLEALTKVYSA